MSYYERYGRAWYQRNRERRIARQKELKAQDPDYTNKRSRARYHERYRIKKLAKTYHTTVEHIIELEQQTRCAICKRETALNIDHNHATGRVRQRLCANCNRGLGLFKEEISTLCNAIEYLEQHE